MWRGTIEVEGYHRGGGVPQMWRGTTEVEGYHRGGTAVGRV